MTKHSLPTVPGDDGGVLAVAGPPLAPLDAEAMGFEVGLREAPRRLHDALFGRVEAACLVFLVHASLPTSLLRLFNPERSNHTRAEERLNKLQGFVLDVMNDPCTSVLVSHESYEISLKTSDAGYLPLDSLGTGVTELVILASIIACNDNRIICIEEPEIHLHPALQARFMKYLLEDDSNRFIITTHSPTVINYPGVQVSHASKANGVSRCKQLDSLGCSRDLLDDLGVKASDLLQASFIVWVEGPSDRIYLTYWIKRWSDEHNI
ncbi:hypothetical protein DW878_10130 [Olsenella sp. AM39-30AC]|nr:hypothetical protein DW878_10130 [Olsenella sp. AM39-30AC]